MTRLTKIQNFNERMQERLSSRTAAVVTPLSNKHTLLKCLSLKAPLALRESWCNIEGSLTIPTEDLPPRSKPLRDCPKIIANAPKNRAQSPPEFIENIPDVAIVTQSAGCVAVITEIFLLSNPPHFPIFIAIATCVARADRIRLVVCGAAKVINKQLTTNNIGGTR